jgi:holo-[acyl-carrier protein] synthase
VILGIGIDVVNISRFKYYSETIPTFLSKLFSPQELKLSCSQLAGNYAANEAFLKACPANYRHSVSTIEVLRDADGRPTLAMYDIDGIPLSALKAHISLTNLENITIAMIVIEHRGLHP